MPSSSNAAVLIATYITHLRASVTLLQDETLATDTLVLDTLLSLERMLDRGRVLYAMHVPLEDRHEQSAELHAELDSLRAVIATRLQALPPAEARALLQSRLNEAGSSWWHLIRLEGEQ